MTHCRLPRFATAALVLLALSGGATGAEIFKWVDEEGIVHFSDTKPANTESFEILSLESTNAADYDPASDPYSILNQAARVSDARAQTRLESQAPEQEAAPDDYADWRYADYVDTRYPGYVAPVYLPPPPLLRPARHAPNAARRQVNALESLNVPAQRPHSINSGAHRERVLQSRELPLARSGRPPGPNDRPAY